ncbi:DUF167 domain-containing protein [Pararhodobacter zhoushanensis]|uniref:UPF0235 protein OKW52_20095 n=1 Tax=Pararhodobacter zhoushanensis TaxID=2479545 RepID=A0ABT3H3W6_9RHOB|nr:DUF167 domain-containing protein [Pararhodobacter zhoushanensis]MCW1934492.1 DUF167 domain-containing protein [Pararhodobacter zhoushanensis]
MSLPDLSARALPGARLNVRATPKARRNAVEDGDVLKIWVTAAPEDGKANDAIRKILAKSLGVAPTRLTLLRGQTARDKLFQLD